MRHAWGILLLLVVLLPSAVADEHRPPREDRDEDPMQSIADGAKGLQKVPPVLGVLGLILLGLALLGLGGLLASKARKPVPRKLPKKGFERGRVQGRQQGAVSGPQALVMLGKSPIGRVTEATPEPDGRLRVVVERGKRDSCEQVAGFLTGLMESAWATDVRLFHPECGGAQKNARCVYELVPVLPEAGKAVSARGPKGAKASTRG